MFSVPSFVHEPSGWFGRAVVPHSCCRGDRTPVGDAVTVPCKRSVRLDIQRVVYRVRRMSDTRDRHVCTRWSSQTTCWPCQRGVQAFSVCVQISVHGRNMSVDASNTIRSTRSGSQLSASAINHLLPRRSSHQPSVYLIPFLFPIAADPRPARINRRACSSEHIVRRLDMQSAGRACP